MAKDETKATAPKAPDYGAIVAEYSGHKVTMNELPVESAEYIFGNGLRTVLTARTSVDSDKKASIEDYEAWCAERWAGRLEELKSGRVPRRGDAELTFKVHRVLAQLKRAKTDEGKAKLAEYKAVVKEDAAARAAAKEAGVQAPAGGARGFLEALVGGRDAEWHKSAEAAYAAKVEAEKAAAAGAGDF